MDLGNIREEITNIIATENNRAGQLEKIDKSAQSLSQKNMDELIAKCNYKKDSLLNAHKYSNVATQDEIESYTSELNNISNELNTEIIDIEKIRGDLESVNVSEFKATADRMIQIIDDVLVKANSAVLQASEILNNNFEHYMDQEIVNEPVAQERTNRFIQEDLHEPQEYKTDSISDLENELNNEFQPILENNVNDENRVVSTENVPEESIPSYLMSATKDEEKTQNVVSGISSAINDGSNQELVSAESVDDGFVKVTNREYANDDEKVQDNDGQARVRRIA